MDQIEFLQKSLNAAHEALRRHASLENRAAYLLRIASFNMEQFSEQRDRWLDEYENTGTRLVESKK
jgi:hypothetical protein